MPFSRLARVLIGLHIILTGTGDLSIAPTLSSGPLPYLATTAFPANSFPDGSEDFSVASASSWGGRPLVVKHQGAQGGKPGVDLSGRGVRQVIRVRQEPDQRSNRLDHFRITKSLLGQRVD